MKLDETTPAEERARWKAVRTDSLRDIPGEIVSADEQTGECVIDVHGQKQEWKFGSHGLRIMLRRR